MAKPKPKPSKVKTAVKSKPKTAAKPKASSPAKTSAKAPAKATPKRPVTATSKAKPAAKPLAQPATKPVAAKVSKAPMSALEPKNGQAPHKSKSGAIPAKAGKAAKSGKAAKGDTDSYESKRPGTAAFRRAASIPVVATGADGSKSPFTEKELKEWRAVLLEKRSELTDDIAGLVKDAMEAEDGHTTPNHIAERGSDADLQDMSLGMAGQEEVVLWEIDRALRKIDFARPLPFGLCEFTKQAIAHSRLHLLPWTPLSIEGAQHMEENHLAMEDLLIDD